MDFDKSDRHVFIHHFILKLSSVVRRVFFLWLVQVERRLLQKFKVE